MASDIHSQPPFPLLRRKQKLRRKAGRKLHAGQITSVQLVTNAVSAFHFCDCSPDSCLGLSDHQQAHEQSISPPSCAPRFELETEGIEASLSLGDLLQEAPSSGQSAAEEQNADLGNISPESRDIGTREKRRSSYQLCEPPSINGNMSRANVVVQIRLIPEEPVLRRKGPRPSQSRSASLATNWVSRSVRAYWSMTKVAKQIRLIPANRDSTRRHQQSPV